MDASAGVSQYIYATPNNISTIVNCLQRQQRCLPMSDQLPTSADKLSVELRILLFGDQTADTQIFIRNQLVAGRTNSLLCIFLDRVAIALRQEVSELSPLERRRMPSFSTVDDLVDRAYSKEGIHPGIDSALLCISQITQYFE